MARGLIGRRAYLLSLALLFAALVTIVGGKPAVADQGESSIRSFQAGTLVAGFSHTCAVLDNGAVRCWGSGLSGRLGYSNTNDIGDNETPGSVGPVDLGVDRSAVALATGDTHTCALLDNGTVRCWGLGFNGQLGYGNTNTIGDNETPGSVGPVDLGAGRKAVAITAGGNFTCALLDNGEVRCWGGNVDGELGYGNTTPIGDNETPGSVGPVDLGAGRTAVAVSAGVFHTCALLDNGAIRCWGFGPNGRLGYGNTTTIGDNETPGSVGPVDLGAGRSAVAVSGGLAHTCALLDNGAVRCWGSGGSGQLGYANTTTIGDDEAPGSVGPVDLGAGRSAVAVATGDTHTCALLNDAAVRCWGSSSTGQLGYGNTTTIGDNETPGSVGPVDLGVGRSAAAVAAGGSHTCALLDTGAVRCWGSGGNGRLGYANTTAIGDNETPGSVGPVSLGGLLTANVADLSLSASAIFSRVDVGSSFFVRFEISNSGPDTAPGAAVQTALVSSGVTIGAISPSRGTFNTGTGRWSVGPLLSGQSASLKINLTANSAGSIFYAGQTSNSIFDSAPANNQAQVEIAVGSLAGPTGPTGTGSTGPTGTGSTGPTGTGSTGPTGPIGPSRLAVALTSKKFTGKAKKKLTLLYAATEKAAVTVKVLKGKKSVAKAKGNARQGANSIKVKLPKKPGSYRLELSAKAGAVTAKATAKLKVKK